MNENLRAKRDELAEKYVFGDDKKWSNNNDECGDNFGSFSKGFSDACEILLPLIEELKESNSNCISIALHESRVQKLESDLKFAVECLKDVVRSSSDIIARKHCSLIIGQIENLGACESKS